MWGFKETAHCGYVEYGEKDGFGGFAGMQDDVMKESG
jgi:hypothetical protein